MSDSVIDSSANTPLPWNENEDQNVEIGEENDREEITGQQ
jgi:hypothetical protein